MIANGFGSIFSFEDGLRLVKLRAEAMQVTITSSLTGCSDFSYWNQTSHHNFLQAAADSALCGMVSIIGLDADKVQQLCDSANQEVDEAGRVQIANFLSPVRLF